jgi:hypothetical protein
MDMQEAFRTGSSGESKAINCAYLLLNAPSNVACVKFSSRKTSGGNILKPCGFGNSHC